MSEKESRFFYQKIHNRAFQYSILTILINLGFALLVTGGSVLFLRVSYEVNIWLIGVCVFLIACLFAPIRELIANTIDFRFNKHHRRNNDLLLTFSNEIAKTQTVVEVTNLLYKYIQDVLAPEIIHIFLYNPFSDGYEATRIPGGMKTSDIEFPANTPLADYLRENHKIVLPSGEQELPKQIVSEQHRIQLLMCKTIIALPGDEKISGWVGISDQKSGEVYHSSDISMLDSLCQQTANAIEKFNMVSSLEYRVKEMDVLARISEMVNITINLDDILELIYTQTSRVIPADDFHIKIIDQDTDSLLYIFYVENNERIGLVENRFFSRDNSLESEVIYSKRSIITNDYTNDIKHRGIVDHKPGIKSWICVPLNSGAETIGCLSLGSRSPEITYTPTQSRLLEAIADQAAGAIVKSKLLTESERRARQFIALNEISRQLTSTFDIATLLQLIVDNVVKILNCEAGSLLLVDEQTDELVFTVAVGPVASELINKRLPPGVGIVGKSVKTRQPVIVNNIRSAQEWYSQTDRQTGFTTEGLLVIPLAYQENIFGAIEVLNKNDHSPFNKDDQILLEAFSAQAAVAITNARLYKLTDQELSTRVEELSIMQRIDRELNSKLDSHSTMTITLEWAMRQSGAEAGFVGAIRESDIIIMSSQGYTDELNEFINQPFPLSKLKQFATSLIQGEPLNIVNQADITLLKSAHSQIIIPILLENKTNGVIFLERNTANTLPDEVMQFLIRLSDHASTAISNAELYSAVQAANLAKSEFVSFVSHELKNPMTSIKGYTELLAAGAVGPISDAQANFLMTIKTNVERMATLVSDLADISRIEAGRLRLDFKSIPLNDIIDEVIRSRQHQLNEKKHQVEVSIPSNLPNVWADRIRVVQILTNLVSNANKYTPENGIIKIACEASDNIWDQSGSPKVIHISVADSGIGINEEDQKKIFQKFFRSEDSKAREAPGTGLGLNITLQLVEKQGGKIWFNSVFRQGTTFHFTLPVSTSD